MTRNSAPGTWTRDSSRSCSQEESPSRSSPPISRWLPRLPPRPRREMGSRRQVTGGRRKSAAGSMKAEDRCCDEVADPVNDRPVEIDPAQADAVTLVEPGVYSVLLEGKSFEVRV